ncbi:MAG: hypothetical protein ABH812_00250, partial [bacterium]
VTNYKIDKQDKEIILTFKKLFEITRIRLSSDNIYNCTSPKGYVETTVRDGLWRKLPESFPATQMNKRYDINNFSYYFLADEISSVKFIFDSSDSCVLDDSKITVYALE